MKKVFFVLIVLFLISGFSLFAEGNKVLVLKIDGIIGPPMQNYILNNFEEAEKLNADFVLLEINTPGGLSSRCVLYAMKL